MDVSLIVTNIDIVVFLTYFWLSFIHILLLCKLLHVCLCNELLIKTFIIIIIIIIIITITDSRLCDSTPQSNSPWFLFKV